MWISGFSNHEANNIQVISICLHNIKKVFAVSLLAETKIKEKGNETI